MRAYAITPEILEETASGIRACAQLAGLNEDKALHLAKLGQVIDLNPGEMLLEEGSQSDSIWVILRGEAVVLRGDDGSGSPRELPRVRPSELIGEVGVLLQQPRSASVQALEPVRALKIPGRLFAGLCQYNALVGLETARLLAARLAGANRHIRALALVPEPRAPQPLPPPRPVEQVGPSSSGVVVSAEAWEAEIRRTPTASASLDYLLRKTVSCDASDLHLCAGLKPRLRIHGVLQELAEHTPIGPHEVLHLFGPLLDGRLIAELRQHHDVDFAHHVPGVGRFRVNVFHDARGFAAALRLVPSRIRSFEELQLPPVVQSLCDHPSGLVLVTGATGSGKSTTLATMIDHINRTRTEHLITLEDPIEYVHESRLSLVNQREVGCNSSSFSRALRAALREDPDVVLVGEMRDQETVSLTLELASTGHLVFATLHTHSAAGAIERILGLFSDEQLVRVRLLLAEVLRGVVSQTLCQRADGTRQVAAEVLVVNYAISNLIREDKLHQIQTMMEAGKGLGNVTMNEALAKLVRDRTVDYAEGWSKSRDKADFARRVSAPVSVVR